MIEYIEEIWHGMLIVAAVLVLVALMIVFLGDKHVDGYYLSTGSNKGACVYAHWTWHPDELAFCSDDQQKALDFAKQANDMLKK